MKHVETSLPDYITNSLLPSNAEDVRVHLLTCSQCRSEYEHLASAMASLSTLELQGPSNAYFTTIVPRLRERLVAPRRKSFLDTPLFERIFLPAVITAFIGFIFISIPTGTSERSDLRQSLQPIVRELTQDELIQLESDSQFGITGAAHDTFGGFLLDERLTNGPTVPTSVLNDALAGGEVDEAVSGLMENLPEEELEAVVQQLGERTVVRL
jgi:predicted anti-sigma-YlaC factor YlaD